MSAPIPEQDDQERTQDSEGIGWSSSGGPHERRGDSSDVERGETDEGGESSGG